MRAANPVPLFRSYADPRVLTDEVIRLYLEPLLSSPQRIDAFARYWLGFDNRHTVAVHDALKTLTVPTLIVWGLKDIFFDVKWAYWLKDTIPGAKRVVEVEDGRLFFPEDRPDAMAKPLLEFWDECLGQLADPNAELIPARKPLPYRSRSLTWRLLGQTKATACATSSVTPSRSVNRRRPPKAALSPRNRARRPRSVPRCWRQAATASMP